MAWLFSRIFCYLNQNLLHSVYEKNYFQHFEEDLHISFFAFYSCLKELFTDSFNLMPNRFVLTKKACFRIQTEFFKEQSRNEIETAQKNSFDLSLKNDLINFMLNLSTGNIQEKISKNFEKKCKKLFSNIAAMTETYIKWLKDY